MKVPTEEFFMKDMGLPLEMTPNYEDFSCQVSRIQAEAPKPPILEARCRGARCHVRFLNPFDAIGDGNPSVCEVCYRTSKAPTGNLRCFFIGCVWSRVNDEPTCLSPLMLTFDVVDDVSA